MTEKLYDSDAYMTSFSARVLSCTEDGGGRFSVVLDRTAFFPESGGQGGDTGRLGEAAVLHTGEDGGEIRHCIDRALPVGATVEGEIDFSARFDRMQNHTGEHIVSGLAHRLFGCTNVGFHLSDSETTVDFDRPLTRGELDRLEELACEAVYRDLPVTARYPSEQELRTLDYRSKGSLHGAVRVVHIPDYDDCACCAPHVRRTGEIGGVSMPDFMRYKGGVRIRLLCGARAAREARACYRELSAAAQLCRLPRLSCADGVRRLSETAETLRAENAALSRALADARVASVPAGTHGNLCFFEPLLEEGGRRRLALGACERTDGVCAVFSGSDREGYRFCLAGHGLPLRGYADRIGTALNGRCGGSDELLSGRAGASRKTIERYFAGTGFDAARE